MLYTTSTAIQILAFPRRVTPTKRLLHVCVNPVRRFITESVCERVSCPRATPLSSNARLLKNVDYGACASVSWPCMCVSARFEGLLQRVCVSQQSSCSSSHGPPFSPLASPPFTALASRESAQSTRRAWRGKTHASDACDSTGSTARGPRRACWCGRCGGGRHTSSPHGVSGRPGGSWRRRVAGGGARGVAHLDDHRHFGI